MLLAGDIMELLEFAGRVGLALLLGTLIGLERQFTQHPAGLRTNALVAVGAALFVSLTPFLGETNSPSRIASYIVVGVGFLGGGAISKDRSKIRGLTTGAALWCSAAVGTLAGAGFGLHAAIGTILVLVVLGVFHPLDSWITDICRRTPLRKTHYRIRVLCREDEHGAVCAAINRLGEGNATLTVTGITVRRKRDQKRVWIVAELHTKSAGDAVRTIVNKLLDEPGVTAASCEQRSADTE